MVNVGMCYVHVSLLDQPAVHSKLMKFDYTIAHNNIVINYSYAFVVNFIDNSLF
jgi:hypothetical protein